MSGRMSTTAVADVGRFGETSCSSRVSEPGWHRDAAVRREHDSSVAHGDYLYNCQTVGLVKGNPAGAMLRSPICGMKTEQLYSTVRTSSAR